MEEKNVGPPWRIRVENFGRAFEFDILPKDWFAPLKIEIEREGVLKGVTTILVLRDGTIIHEPEEEKEKR